MPLLDSFSPLRCRFFLTLVLVTGTIANRSVSGQSQEPSEVDPPASSTVDEPDSKIVESFGPRDFARDVFPILQQHCLKCHGAEKQEGDLRVDRSDILLTEDFVTPGDAANSRMYEVLISEDDDRMPPPAEEDPVPTNEIVVIKSWIDEGAKWSDISGLLAVIATVDQDPATKAVKPLGPRTAYWLNVWRAFGDFHPAIVHFPIALLVVGGLFALFGLRGSYRCSDFAFYCLWMGALSAIVASGVGWSFAWNEGHNEDPFVFDQQAELFWHRWTGVLLAVVAFLVAVWATIARRRDPENGTFWKLCLIVLAGFTIYVGHAGGELTHRRGYRRLFELIGVQAPAKPAVVQPANESAANDDS